MRKTMLLLAMLAPLAAGAQSPLASEGGRIAARWCAGCHAITPGAPPPAGDAVPPFAAVAARPATTEMSLRVFLGTPHVSMPDYQLSRAETDALVAYILSQRR